MDSEQGAAPPPIVGGAASDAHPEVGVLYAVIDGERAAFCTAGLVAEDVVLTAAHCVDGALGWLAGGADLAFGRGRSLGSLRESAPLEAAAVHPGWDPETLAHDIALIRLAEPLEGAELLRLSAAVPTDTSPESLRFVGFGLTGLNADDAGVRRAVDLRYDHADLRFLYTWDEAGANLCSGDSGAPALLIGGDGSAAAVGVASFVYQTEADQPLCETGGTGITRLDTHLDWVEGVLAAVPADDEQDLGGGSLGESEADLGGMTLDGNAKGSNCGAAPAQAGLGLAAAGLAALLQRARSGPTRRGARPARAGQR